MKMENRNFGKKRQLVLFILLVSISVQVVSCIENANAKKSIGTMAFNEKLNNGFISDKYLKDTPLASIVNVSTYEEREVPFTLNKEANLQIYGVGEAGVGYMDGKPDYLFKSDDIAFYFDFANRKSDVIANQEGQFAYDFSWLDGTVKSNQISFFKQGSEYYGYYDTLNKNYIAEIKFPWKTFNIAEMNADTTMGFDLAVGDNDDGTKQTGKLTWHNQADDFITSTRGYGMLSLVKSLNKSASSDTLFSCYANPIVDGKIDSLWNSIPSYELNNMVMGINDPEDLSASVKTCWDKENLYFLVTVHDQSKKQVKSKSIRNLRTLSDFGWIEDDKGNKIWEMHIKDAVYAGGAQKNIKIDQAVHLKAGKYKLKYFSDESHALNNWDDAPPTTPFYGIVVYRCK